MSSVTYPIGGGKLSFFSSPDGLAESGTTGGGLNRMVAGGETGGLSTTGIGGKGGGTVGNGEMGGDTSGGGEAITGSEVGEDVGSPVPSASFGGAGGTTGSSSSMNTSSSSDSSTFFRIRK